MLFLRVATFYRFNLWLFEVISAALVSFRDTRGSSVVSQRPAIHTLSSGCYCFIGFAVQRFSSKPASGDLLISHPHGFSPAAV